MSIAPLSRLSNVNRRNSHNKYFNSMMTGNYSTLLIYDSVIAGLFRYSNIWKRYFKLLNALNCGIFGTEWKIFFLSAVSSLVIITGQSIEFI